MFQRVLLPTIGFHSLHGMIYTTSSFRKRNKIRLRAASNKVNLNLSSTLFRLMSELLLDVLAFRGQATLSGSLGSCFG